MKGRIGFVVHGPAQPAGSKRPFAIQKNGKPTGQIVVVDANPNARNWKQEVSHAAYLEMLGGELWTGPLRLVVTFYRTRPASHYGTGRNADKLKNGAPEFPTSKPDATKLVRGVEDALTGIVWRDDAQIVDQHVYKRFGPTAGAAVAITQMEGSEWNQT